MLSEAEVQQTVREFLVQNIFEGKEDAQLKNDTPLISSRLMDSIVALKLVSFLEEKFGIEFEASEVDQDNLDSIAVITAFVQKKKK